MCLRDVETNRLSIEIGCQEILKFVCVVNPPWVEPSAKSSCAGNFLEKHVTIDHKAPTSPVSICRQFADKFHAPAFSAFSAAPTPLPPREDTGRSPGGFSPSSTPLQLGRVDVFLATDFHGGPFREREKGNNSSQEDHATAVASASQSGCDVSLGSMSLVPTERGTIVSGVATGDYVVDGSERPWFSRHVLTAG